MKDYKNIDRLFQEKFRDFEQDPSSHVWEDINDILSGKPKKDRRALWLWLSGVAAGLALLVTFNYPFTTSIITPDISNTNDINIKNPVKHNTEITNTTTKKLNTTPDKTNSINQKRIEKKKTNTTQKNYVLSPVKIQNNTKIKNQKVDKTYIVSNESSDQKSKTIIPDLKEEGLNDKNFTAQTNKTFKEVADKSTISSHVETNEVEKSIALNKNTEKEDVNTIPLESVNKNNKKLDASKKKNHTKKWAVSTLAAPVLFGAFEKDVSSIDSQFNDNTKKGQLSTAYGVQLAYHINDRFRIQSGLHKVDYAYKTYDVYVSPDRYASFYSNISYDEGINVLEINPIPLSSDSQGNETAGNKDMQGSLTQVFGYYEIPLETKYNIKKGDLDINLLSGISTLILTKNEIYIQTNEFSSKIGEASNLNSLNLTGNLGLEFDYKLYQNIHFNLTPIFKIHANTFKKDTGGFSPYAIGAYSGLNFRF